MSILICNECKGKVSDRAIACPHCGCPITCSVDNNKRQYTVVNNIEYDVTDIVELILSNDKIKLEKARELIVSIMNISPIKFIKPVYDLKVAPAEINCKTLDQYREEQQAIQASKIKCPNCHSTGVKRISGTERVASVASLGIFSKKINKTYKCLDCKYTW